MPYALVSEVAFGDMPADASQKMVTEVILPAVKQAPGFQSGLCLRSADGKTGRGSVVFDTEANAKQAQENMKTMRPAEAPPITGSAIWEVTPGPEFCTRVEKATESTGRLLRTRSSHMWCPCWASPASR